MADVVEVERLFGIPLVDLPRYQKAEPIGTTPIAESETLNVELLEEIMEFIRLHPTAWQQDAWFRVVNRATGNAKYVVEREDVEEVNSCGTAFCFAGHVALREGFPSPPLDNRQEWEREVIDEDNIRDWETAEEYARKRLGISQEVADVLFGPYNEMKDLENMVTALKLSNGKVSSYKLEDINYDFDGVASAEDIQKWLDDEE